MEKRERQEAGKAGRGFEKKSGTPINKKSPGSRRTDRTVGWVHPEGKKTGKKSETDNQERKRTGKNPEVLHPERKRSDKKPDWANAERKRTDKKPKWDNANRKSDFGEKDAKKPYQKNGNQRSNTKFSEMPETGKKIQGERIRKERPERKGKRAFGSVCPYAKNCGSCDYQGMEYEKQLKEKQEYVKKNVGEFCKVLPIIGMEHPYHYRNKVHAVFDIAKGGSIISGVYKAGTHDVINIDECQIEDETAGAIIRDIRSLLRSFKIKTYDEDTGYGLLRHVLIRRGFHSGEVMVVLVLGSPILPSKNNFVKALRKLHPEITTVVVNVNNKRTSMVLGDKETVIYGKGYIEDTLCGCTFRISPKSFYQINPVQTEILYERAIAYAGLTGKETVVDAYCGIGTIGLIAAKKAKEVIGVELNRDGVRDAMTNAKKNDIKNIQFYNADAGVFMEEMASFNASNDKEKATGVDVVFMDPPRAGSDEAFLESVIKLAPKKVVYVSCNPETLSRDLGFLTKRGYEAVECQPVDLFPFTKHVETVVMLSHKKPDSVINVKVEFGEGEGKVPLDNIAKRAAAYKPKERVSYKMIKEYIEAKYGFKVHTAYIAEVKRELGLSMYDAPNAVEELKQPRKHPTAEKVEAIKDALKHFGTIK